uniref:Uncharacterized protein n=1 Tax=Romanomermis culicivorax TaxID=13658 RepID=A0A915KZT7_ROMCU
MLLWRLLLMLHVHTGRWLLRTGYLLRWLRLPESYEKRGRYIGYGHTRVREKKNLPSEVYFLSSDTPNIGSQNSELQNQRFSKHRSFKSVENCTSQGKESPKHSDSQNDDSYKSESSNRHIAKN